MARAARAVLVEPGVVTSVSASDFCPMKMAQECVAGSLAVLVVAVDNHHLVACLGGWMNQDCDPARRQV